MILYIIVASFVNTLHLNTLHVTIFTYTYYKARIRLPSLNNERITMTD